MEGRYPGRPSILLRVSFPVVTVLPELDRDYRSGTTKVRAEWLSTVTMLTETPLIDDHLYRHLAAAADGLVGHNSKTTVITFVINGQRWRNAVPGRGGGGARTVNLLGYGARCSEPCTEVGE